MKPETCVAKKTHEDGEPIMPQKTWCGGDFWENEVAFGDVTHFLFAVESESCWGYPYCQQCVDSIQEALDMACPSKTRRDK